MLALTRKKGDSIIIGDNIELIVLDIQGDQVRIGIDAPRNIAVHRKEIYDQIQQENKTAAISSQSAVTILEKLIKNKK